MAKFVVEYDKRKCIGSGVCEAVCPEFWVVREDGKAELKGSTLNESTGLYELGIEEKELECNKRAAEGCPPECMKIKNVETGEYIEIKR